MLRWIVATSFIAIALWTLKPDTLDDDDSALPARGAFVATTIAFFIAEIGDKTQVATVLLAAKYSPLWQVVAGTTLGMLLANVPVVAAGQPLRIAAAVARGADRGGAGVPGAGVLGAVRRRSGRARAMSSERAAARSTGMQASLPRRGHRMGASRTAMLRTGCEGGMRRSMQWFATWWHLLARPDEVMLEIGAGGELLVARLRALLSRADPAAAAGQCGRPAARSTKP